MERGKSSRELKAPPHSYVHTPIGKESGEGWRRIRFPSFPPESVLAAGKRKPYKYIKTQ